MRRTFSLFRAGSVCVPLPLNSAGRRWRRAVAMFSCEREVRASRGASAAPRRMNEELKETHRPRPPFHTPHSAWQCGHAAALALDRNHLYRQPPWNFLPHVRQALRGRPPPPPPSAPAATMA